MKPFGIGVALVVLSFVAFSQAPTAPVRTLVRGHAIGESLTQYVTESGHAQRIAECRSAVAAGSERGRKLLNQMSTEWHSKVTLAGCVSFLSAVDGRAARYKTSFPDVGDPGASCVLAPNQAIFEHGKLAQIDLCIEQSLDEQLPYLTESYGKPTTTRTSAADSGHGVNVALHEAEWNMPDGAVILAQEHLSNGYAGAMCYTTIRVTSERQLQQSQRGERKQPKTVVGLDR